jgi:hypothetical protein
MAYYGDSFTFADLMTIIKETLYFYVSRPVYSVTYGRLRNTHAKYPTISKEFS